MAVVPSTGWGVLHLFFHLQRHVLDDAERAAKDFAQRLEAFDAVPDQQALAFVVLGQKADLGLMLLAPDLEALHGFTAELAGSPLGQALAPAGSYVSLTEESEYTATEDDERARLVAEEGLHEGSPELDQPLREWNERMSAYREHRCIRGCPRKRCCASTR